LAQGFSHADSSEGSFFGQDASSVGVLLLVHRASDMVSVSLARGTCIYGDAATIR
jgi:hypothetical protein